MRSLLNNIDLAFSQTLEGLNAEFGKKDAVSSLYVKFRDQQSMLFYYAKGEEPKPIEFGKMISQKMIAMGLTIEKIYMALLWLTRQVQQDFNMSEREEISLLLFSTEQMKFALIGVCIRGQHRVSYPMADLLNQFESKQEQLN